MRKAFFLAAAAALFSLAAGEACQISDMNLSETNQLWKNIFGFVAEELNGLREEALKRNVPGQVQQVTVYAGALEEWTVREIAGLTNTDPLALAREFGVYPGKRATRTDAERTGKKEGEVLSEDDVLDYKLSRAQVLDIANRKPGTASVLNKLLGVAPVPEKEVSPYQNMKVRMPGEQKDVPLSAILDLPGINSSDCFLSNSDIKGRLEFVALLDSDLRLGAEGFSSKNAPGQHITYSRATASIGPYDSSIVIPKQFERYVTDLGNWASLDMYLTIAESLYIAYDVSLMKAQIAKKTAARDELSRLSATGMKDWPKASTDYDKLEGFVEVGGKQYNAKQFKQLYLEGGVSTEEFEKITHTVFKAPAGVSQDDVSNAVKAVEGMGLNKEIMALGADEKILTDLAKKVQQRTITTFGFGLAWLGPARFALDLANSLLLESSTAGRDQYFDLYINNRKFLSDFRKATDFMGTGGVTDFASDVMGQGVPTKVYETKPVYLINNPLIDRDKPSIASTGFRQEAGRWLIDFNWKEAGENRAEGVFFEDVTSLRDYTSMAFSSKNQVISVGMDRRKFTAEMYRALELAAPVFNFLLYRVEAALPASAVGLGQLAIYNFIINRFIDPAGFNKEEKCDPERVTNFLGMYKGLVVASHAEVLLLYVGGPLKVVEYFGGLAKTAAGKMLYSAAETAANVGQKMLYNKFTNALLFLDPIQLAKQLYGTRGQRYVSYCKDDEYKVVAWQRLSVDKKKGLTETLQQSGVEQLTKGLNIGQALSGLGKQVKAAQLGDVLSFRAVYYDPRGALNSPKLVYLHLDGGTQQWHSVYSQVGACFKANHQSKDGNTVFILDENGVRKTVNGTEVMKLAGPDWKARALMHQRLPGLAATLVPNRIITTVLDCGPSAVMEVDSKGNLSAGRGCPRVDCLVAGVLETSGETDFSKAVGTVRTIQAEKGTIAIDNGVIFFYDKETGRETRVPSIEATDAGMREAGRVVITGEGRVKIIGYIGKEAGELDAGYLYALLADFARIEFEPPTGTLRATVYSMARMLGTGVLGLNTRTATNKDEAGRDVPAIRVDYVRGKTGFKEDADKFNKALEKIQGPTGGLQMLETPDYTYFFTTDAQGNPVLKIYNKKTGQTREIPIIGPITRDAHGNMVVPTKEGPFTFKLDMRDGKPVLSVNGPGISELATLLAARGPNGILAFNPTTGMWELFNGQDIPWNRDFAENGLSVFGTPDGPRGVAQQSLFAPPRREAIGYGLGPLAAMPAWPDGVWLVIMIGAIAAGAALVRVKWRN